MVAIEADRRVRRTQRLLLDALINLILERGYDRVTVGDVLERADVGRSTFYSHFRDKQDLLLSAFAQLRGDLQQELDGLAAGPPSMNAPGPALVLFTHAHQHRAVYRALCGKQGGVIVHRHLHTMFSELMLRHLQPHLDAAGNAIPVPVVVEALTSAALGLLTWWLDHDMPHPPADIARMYQQLTTPGLLALLPSAPSPERA